MMKADIMRMAKDAGARFDHMTWVERDLAPVFERFAYLVAAAEREACAKIVEKPNMPEQYVMVGRFMLQPHPQNGYWLTDTGTCEAMQIFQPEMERVIKDLWKQF